jgi:hypothetical protein
VWVLNSGAPWRDLPRRYGPVGTVSSRFYRWRRSGVWRRVLEALQALADAEGRVGWDLHFLDSTVVGAPPPPPRGRPRHYPECRYPLLPGEVSAHPVIPAIVDNTRQRIAYGVAADAARTSAGSGFLAEGPVSE